MKEGFQPLGPTSALAKVSAEARLLRVVAGAGETGASLAGAVPAGEGGSGVGAVRPLTSLAAAAAAVSAGEPKVTLERDGDRVSRILVQCPCGHVIELTCEY